ncbi:PHD domain containing protein [Aphelenchoides avenae]|nr:PHD domain containing protein [Aphelenchus avenae]
MFSPTSSVSATKGKKQCFCKAKESSSKESICCDGCQIWYHEICVAIPPADFERIDKFYCLLCISKNAKLRTSYKAPAPVRSSTEELVEKLLSAHQSLIAKLDVVCESIAKLTNRVDEIETEVRSGRSQASQPAAAAAEIDIASVVSQVIADQHAAERKTLRAVIEFVPEQTEEEDRALVTAIAEKCDLAEQLDADHIHRHGKLREDRGRIMKVPFKSTEARNQFIRKFNSVKNSPEIKALCDRMYVRRDLTPLELKTHHALKKRAYDQNASCGLYQFRYSDLRIITLPDPQPLRKAPARH